MNGFISRVIATMMLAIVLELVVALTGLVNMRTDNPPSKIETILAGQAMDASVERAAPQVANPTAAGEANPLAGARLYRENCTLCHGDPAHPKSPLADSLNPPSPQFMSDKADMLENQNRYIIEHGVRSTGMPGWGRVLSEEQIWQAVIFLSHMDNLPRIRGQRRTEFSSTR